MAVIKCKMCGGDLSVNPGENIAICEYCGTQQTLPRLDSDRKANLYDRANHFRRNNEYDKAASIYEQVLCEDAADSEAYWSLVLCRYGIEYIEDPATRRRVPTVNRAQFTSVFDDVNYQSALQYADASQSAIYKQEAQAINEIQKGILAISQNEEPFDVFICYKETDNNGRRTPDSVLATELYHELTKEGFKVFFSRITLEDKLGSAYEPYIFAALNSARVMVVIGTSHDNFNAVWVRNEWSRYLDLMKQDISRLLIPCYRDMDVGDIPKELPTLQSQDMSKPGFVQYLVRGINKVLANEEPASDKSAVVANDSNSKTDPLLRRAFLFLDDEEWNKANEYCEKVLDTDPENAMAYVGKLCAELRARSKEGLAKCDESFAGSKNYQKAVRFADSRLKNELADLIQTIDENSRQRIIANIYDKALNAMNIANTEKQFINAAARFRYISGFRDAAEKEVLCLKRAEGARKNAVYTEALINFNSNELSDVQLARSMFVSISQWKNADEMAAACTYKANELERIAEEQRIAYEKAAEEQRIAYEKAAEEQRIAEEKIAEEKRIAEEKKASAKRGIKPAIIISASVVFMIAVVFLARHVIVPAVRYNEAMALLDGEKYDEAIVAFSELGDYGDSAVQTNEAAYRRATALMDEGKYDEAIAAFAGLEGYGDSAVQTNEAAYRRATALMDAGKYDEAIAAFAELGDYGDSAIQTNEAAYRRATALMDAGKYDEAIAAFAGLKGYRDSDVQSNEAAYRRATALMDAGKYDEAIAAFSELGDYGDSPEKQAESETAVLDIKYNDAVALADAGKDIEAAAAFNEIKGHKDAFERCMKLWARIARWETISAGYCLTLGLKTDGTVVATDSYVDVSYWTDIVAVSAESDHAVGLKSDGTVVAVGRNDYGQCNVSGWTDIVSVSAGWYYTVGLRADGTVVAVGDNDDGQCDVSGWTDIVAISAGGSHTVGLKADGTVVAVGANDRGQCAVSGWTDIVAVSAGGSHTVGLRADGTVVAVGYNGYGRCNVSGWTDIVAVSAGDSHTVGLRADGTVVAVGYTGYGQCNVSGWTDIVAVSAGDIHTVGLKADGTVVAVGWNKYGQCNVSGWRDIMLPGEYTVYR